MSVTRMGQTSFFHQQKYRVPVFQENKKPDGLAAEGAQSVRLGRRAALLDHGPVHRTPEENESDGMGQKPTNPQ